MPTVRKSFNSVSLESNGLQKITLNKFATIWSEGFPLQSGLTAARVNELLQQYGVDSIIIEFKTLEQFIEVDKKKFMKRVDSYVKGTDYKIVGDWANVVEQGYVFDTSFTVEIKKGE